MTPDVHPTTTTSAVPPAGPPATTPPISSTSDSAPGALTVERNGIEPIPDDERTSRPLDLFRLAFGGANTLSSCIIGGLTVMLGLSFWQAMTVAVLGLVVGAALLSPVGLIGSASGTNNAVSSSADLGVHGRIVGSVIALVTAIVIFAISVWASGDAIVGTIERIAGVAVPDWAYALAYCFFAIVTIVVCVYGYQFMLLINKISVVAVSALFIVGVFAFAPAFDASYPGLFTADADPETQSLLWPTLVVSLLIVMSNPVGYGAFLGDWSRYLPRDTPRIRTMSAVFFSQVMTIIPFTFGILTASIVARQVPDLAFGENASLVIGMLQIAPAWFFLPLAAIAVLGGVATGTTALYGTGLDFSSMFARLSRPVSTALIGAISLAVIFVGRFVFDMVDTLTAWVTLIITITVPWMVILVVGYVVRRGWYDAESLTVFIRRQRGGRYWFAHGWNLRGIAAWASSATIAVLFINLPGTFVGPLGNLAAGVDLSLPIAAVASAVIYPVLLWLFPTPRYVFSDLGPVGVPSADHALEPITARAGRRAARAGER